MSTQRNVGGGVSVGVHQFIPLITDRERDKEQHSSITGQNQDQLPLENENVIVRVTY